MPRSKTRTHVPAGIFEHGQLHLMGDGSGYRQTGCDLARAGGRPKNASASPIKDGMKRQTKGKLHPYIHGVALDDEPNSGLKSNGQGVSIHDGMGTATPHTRGLILDPNGASKHLRAASVLGRPDRVEDGFDTSHVGHRVSRSAALPASPRGSQAQIMTRTDRKR